MRKPRQFSSVVLSCMLVLIMVVILSIQPVIAQNGPPGTLDPLFLVTGVDVNGQGFPVAVVDLETGEARTLATFASRSVCAPSILPDGTALLYEVATGPSQTTIYQLDTASGQRTTLRESGSYLLGCPVFGPNGNEIAWIHPSELSDDMTSLIVSDAIAETQRELARHSHIFDVVWSPAGSLLVYAATSPETPYPTLYSVPSQGGTDARPFWMPAQGLVLDYEFAIDGSGLLIAYVTDEQSAITLLSTECVIGISSRCDVDPIATFPAEANIDLLDTYSPTTPETVVSVQFSDPTVGFPKADLWIVDLHGRANPRQVSFSPTLLKTDAYWGPDGREIYFVGTTFNQEGSGLRGAIYSVPTNGERQFTLRFASDIFSPANILWRFDR